MNFIERTKVEHRKQLRTIAEYPRYPAIQESARLAATACLEALVDAYPLGPLGERSRLGFLTNWYSIR